MDCLRAEMMLRSSMTSERVHDNDGESQKRVVRRE